MEHAGSQTDTCSCLNSFFGLSMAVYAVVWGCGTHWECVEAQKQEQERLYMVYRLAM
jgi:hypothetical protein